MTWRRDRSTGCASSSSRSERDGVRRQAARGPRRGGRAGRAAAAAHRTRGVRALRRRRARTRAQPLVVALPHEQARRRRSISHDRDDDRDRFRELVGARRHRARGRAAGTLAALGLDYADLARRHPELIWASRHAVRPHAARAARRAGDRPHGARRRRTGVELRLRRPRAAAGPRRRQPGATTSVASTPPMATLVAVLHRERQPASDSSST